MQTMGFEVKVDKKELLDILIKNREEHIKIFHLAVTQYEQEITAYLHLQLELVREHKWIKHRIDLPVPENHADDYDRVISMLGRHVGDTIVIPEGTYRNYVDNEWSWSQAFLINSTSYAEAAGYRG